MGLWYGVDFMGCFSEIQICAAFLGKGAEVKDFSYIAVYIKNQPPLVASKPIPQGGDSSGDSLERTLNHENTKG